ncbi:MAG: uroporphyrinogen decarboxylase [Boseongicola sp. SB0662_bin_57]|nr:uroporphyrinogen decarboxylase [Boseongicola sp. SB0662_bin_57]
MTKKLLRALAGERIEVPPVWMMRQAGRHLPEYRETRTRAGDFLALCYTPELAAEVTLQPIRRYDLDAAILFADILLVPDALGLEVRFVEGDGPRLSTVTTRADFDALRAPDAIHDHLAPVYDTLRIVSGNLPSKAALIGFAGAPWTVASYMIAGKGTPGQGPAHALKMEQPGLFDALIAHLTDTTISYLSAQIEAGAEVVKLFDSWAGSLRGEDFENYAVEPTRRIVRALKSRHPDASVIAFPREAGKRYEGFARRTGADCIALDNSVDPVWAARHVQKDGPVQGNLAPRLLVAGGDALIRETRSILKAFKAGPHVFNLGHGITPDANPDNVHLMIDTIRKRT